jgi:very-short-patch-repair endonuclease
MRGNSSSTAKRIIRRRAVDDADFATVDGIRVTTVARTLLDVALDHPMDVSVPMIDHALRAGLVDAAVVAGLTDGVRGRRGAKQARWAFALADSARESPAESICAVRFHEHGIEGFEPQISFRIDADGTIARVDFFHRAAQVVVEVNGEIKYSDGDPGAARARQERVREFRLRNLGHHVFQLGGADLFSPSMFRQIAWVVHARTTG